MSPDETILRLLNTLYAAPIDAGKWNEFLEQLCIACGVGEGALMAHDVSGKDHRILASLGDRMRAGSELYESYYWQFDEWTLRFPARGVVGQLGFGEDVWPEADLLRSIFYNEFLRKHDICQTAGLVTVGSAGVFEALTIYRGPRETPFDRDQLAVFEMLVPHLNTALAMRRKLVALESRVADLENALDQLTSAVVLLDSGGRVVLVNRAAAALLAQNEGVSLFRQRLICRGVDDSCKLRDLVARAAATGNRTAAYGGGAMQIPRAGKKPLHLLVSPVHSGDTALPRKAVVAVFLSDPELQPALPSEMLRMLFGLTPAETRLTLSIFEGHSLTEAAELNRVSRETVKSQLKAVFAKTGIKRQGELIRFLSRLPGQIG